MKKLLHLLSFILITSGCFAQYKNDNVLYKTIAPTELAKALQNTSGYVLLDVRSKGEYEDTSQFAGYNLGRLKGAVNINVRELGQRLNEIARYKNKPVFVYCSHSQRSRRASKMLADSGFTNITNINGGLTSLHYFGEINKKYFKNLYETKNNYSFISPKELCEKVSAKPSAVFLLDIRSDSLFKHIALQPKENAMGILRGSVNIPYQNLKENLNKIPKNKEIILIDVYDDNTAKSAGLLLDNDFKKVQVLTEGIDRWIVMNETEVSCKKSLYQPAPGYSVISAIDFGKLKNNAGMVVVDVREAEEFNNLHKDSWRNIGKIVNAINIPLAGIKNNISLIAAYKNKPVVVYHFGGNEEAFIAAKHLSDNGFTRVSVLYDGIFGLRWTAANEKGQAGLKNLITDIPEENK